MRLDGTRTQLLVVSGSNMSGKSTLLRTVGINAVLALAGAPVRAERFACRRCASARRFASRTRCRKAVALLRGDQPDSRAGRPRRRPVPLLFLLDELLHGTNSHDRAVGAAGDAGQRCSIAAPSA
jgi:hypothetical protein